ncbi:hypothetical protein GCM10009584_22420 [Ornithinimicrobium humiphilum]|uniref:Uncharacterized protein n=1 Tax=Ornithinimicrobium humiphilum TaxID=125288 RepID=A0A543KN39_9MICO|nr:hypothetical protein [Ornithinimicrobium humiphilum]TQM96464.1 hypothetical protein FB476_1332 [Ornithinimicrobium humiphilum]
MSETYTWSFENADGTPVGDLGLSAVTFPTQADAESWLSQEWPTLADAGVQAVTLRRDEDVVYGPMSLSPAD